MRRDPLACWFLKFLMVMNLLFVATLLKSCTTAQAFVASGESLTALGETFAATGKAMDAALDAKLVTVEQYRDWATFAKRFKAVYPVACDTWKAAIAVNDATAAQHAGAIVASLSADLTSFGALAKKEPAP